MLQDDAYEVVYRKEPTCLCGCARPIVDGWEWDGDYFYDDDCILRFMKEHVLKYVEL